MAKVKVSGSSSSVKRRRPAMSTEAREQQMIALAMDVVEQRLLDGTASAQETTHFLKLASSRAELENEKLREENKLLRAKTEQFETAKDIKGLYENAIKAMRTYSGQGDIDDYDDYDEYDEYDEY